MTDDPRAQTAPTCPCCRGKGWISPDDAEAGIVSNSELYMAGYEHGKRMAGELAVVPPPPQEPKKEEEDRSTTLISGAEVNETEARNEQRPTTGNPAERDGMDRHAAYGGFTDWRWSDRWRNVKAMAWTRRVDCIVETGGRVGWFRRQWFFRLEGEALHVASVIATNFPWMATKPLPPAVGRVPVADDGREAHPAPEILEEDGPPDHTAESICETCGGPCVYQGTHP